MNHINKLKDIGRDRSCLIIGGGHSVNDIDWSRIPDSMYIIGINGHYSYMADMIIYYDKDMQEYYRTRKLKPNQLLIGFKHRNSLDHTNDNCTHYYSYDDMVFGDSGFHALQFADGIFNFKDIYLTGFDYSTEGNSYHYNETESDPIKLDRFKKWSVGKVLAKYGDISWLHSVYNCNKKSKLEIFNFSLPYWQFKLINL